jgi:hypothetical protein
VSRFNLSFRGEILPGYKPEQVKSRFAKLFAIDDPQRVEMFFSGKPINLRRNLDRKEAADVFRKLHDIGLSSELVKVDEDGAATPAAKHPTTESEATIESPPQATSRGMDHDILQRAAGRVDQSWAVPSRKPKSQTNRSSESDQTAKLVSHSEVATDPEVTARKEAAASEQKRIAEQAAARRKAGAEAAKAAAAEQTRIAEQEVSRKKVEAEAAAAAAVEQAHIVELVAARRKAGAVAANAAAAEQARIAEQEAIRKKAEAEAATAAAAEQARIVEQEAARRKAEAEAATAAAAEQARIVEQEAARRKAAAEAATAAAAEQARIVEQQAARRKAEAEAAKAAAAEQARIAEQEAARRKAEAEAAQVVAAEEHRIAEQDTARRKAEAEAAQALVVEEQRIAEQEAARRKDQAEAAQALAAEEQRIAEQDTARRKVEAAIAAAEKMRIAEQQAARKQAEAEAAKAAAAEARRIAKEDAARKKVETDAAKAAADQAKRIAKEDAARKKAETDAAKTVAAEAKRAAREEAARSKAHAKEVAAEAKRIAKDEAARQKSEENALRQAAAEAKRIAQEEAALKKAEEEAIRRAAVEAEYEKAKVIRQAEQEEAIKKADSAKQATINEAARRKAAAEEAERLALAEEAKYLAAAGAARTRAREEHLKAEAAARMAAQEQSGTADLFELQEIGPEVEDATSTSPAAAGPQAASHEANIDAKPPVAKGTPTQVRGKSVTTAIVLNKRLRTRIEVPTRVKLDSSAGPSDPGIKVRRPSQPGAPNLFSILPFRNSTAVRERAQRSQTYYIGGLAATLLAVIALIALSLRFAAAPAPILLAGPDSIAASPAGQLLLIVNARALSHDRSGVAVEEITLPAVPDSSARQPLKYISDEQYMLAAELTDVESGNTSSQLLRCHIPENSCAPALTDNPDEAVAGAIAHTLDGALYIGNHRDGLLRKYSADGKLLAEVSAAIPVAATLRLEDGLIYMNSSQGPAISVFRPDSTNFGTQLDEILLLTPVAPAAKFSKVRDFVRLSGFWWVILENVDSGQARVFQFDSQWGYTREIVMAEGFNPQQLLSWGEKILIRDKQQSVIPRFNSNGDAEVSFESESLAALISEQQANAYTSHILWRICLALIAAITICSGIFAYTHKIRSLVYKSGNTRGAEPIEDYNYVITWLDPARNRRSRFLQLGILYLLGCVGAGAVAVGLGVSNSELFAVLIALSGPIIGIMLLYRSSIGNIGHSGETLALVDHNKLYHIGRGPQIHYRNRFLIVGDVVVYIGASLLPTFDRTQLQQLVPLAEAGIKVDRKAVWIKLIQARHPIAMGTLASLLCLLTAIVLLLL